MELYHDTLLVGYITLPFFVSERIDDPICVHINYDITRFTYHIGDDVVGEPEGVHGRVVAVLRYIIIIIIIN